VERTIEGFRRDDEGDWIADLDCLHSQHVRHRPPFWDRPWVLTEEGRAERVGTILDCPLCDRAELPEGLTVVRTAGPFDAETIPRGLRSDHRVAARTWGLLRVLEGTVGFVLETSPPIRARLVAGDRQAIPPDVPHRLVVDGHIIVAVDFLTAPSRRPRPDSRSPT
jgi:tellurite methyltransferase